MISKSLYKATDCELHFAGYRLDKNRVTDYGTPARDAGTDFHAWRTWALRRMVERNCDYEQGWNLEYLKTHKAVDADLIANDWISTRPDYIAGVELLLSVTEDWQPKDYVPWFDTPGRYQTDAYAGGSLDLLLMPEPQAAVIEDYKTSRTTGSVDPDEGACYALNVFMHFPGVEQVTWRWRFVRLRYTKEVVYTRDQVDDLKRIVNAWGRRIDSIKERHAAGERLEANPFSVACPSCRIRCPHREAATLPTDLSPPSTREDAVDLAERIHTASVWGERARDLLHNWMAEHGDLELPSGTEAVLETSEQRSYPLTQLLPVLGVDGVPDTSPHFDVPLGNLTVASSKLHSYARAKKRQGLRERLDVIADKKPVTKLRIRRRDIDKRLAERNGGA